MENRGKRTRVTEDVAKDVLVVLPACIPILTVIPRKPFICLDSVLNFRGGRSFSVTIK